MGLILTRGTDGSGGIARTLKAEKGLDKRDKELKLYLSLTCHMLYSLMFLV